MQGAARGMCSGRLAACLSATRRVMHARQSTSHDCSCCAELEQGTVHLSCVTQLTPVLNKTTQQRDRCALLHRDRQVTVHPQKMLTGATPPPVHH